VLCAASGSDPWAQQALLLHWDQLQVWTGVTSSAGVNKGCCAGLPLQARRVSTVPLGCMWLCTATAASPACCGEGGGGDSPSTSVNRLVIGVMAPGVASGHVGRQVWPAMGLHHCEAQASTVSAPLAASPLPHSYSDRHSFRHPAHLKLTPCFSHSSLLQEE
jgi:hypothetical protein